MSTVPWEESEVKKVKQAAWMQGPARWDSKCFLTYLTCRLSVIRILHWLASAMNVSYTEDLSETNGRFKLVV